MRRCSGRKPRAPGLRTRRPGVRSRLGWPACFQQEARLHRRGSARVESRTTRKTDFLPGSASSTWSRPDLRPPREVDRRRNPGLRVDSSSVLLRDRHPPGRLEVPRPPAPLEAWAARCQPARPSGARNLDKTPGSQGCCARSGRRSRPLRETRKHRLRQAYSRSAPQTGAGGGWDPGGPRVTARGAHRSAPAARNPPRGLPRKAPRWAYRAGQNPASS
jgi:hypothetical protein